MNINWDDPNLDLDKKEGFITEKTEIITTKKNLNNLLWEQSFSKIMEDIKNNKNIDIKYGEKEWWFIEFYTKDKDLIWKIRHDWFKLDKYNIDYNHLWIEIYEEYKWKWYSKLLYKLYYAYHLENKNIIFPEYELAKKNSRINLLISIWYKLKEIYINWVFSELDEKEKDIILNNVKKDYYWEQKHTYKLILDI